MRRRHATQGEEEHEVDVGGEVAGEHLYKAWNGHEMKVNNMKVEVG